MKELGIKIHELRRRGYSYSKIKEEVNCSLSTVGYYLGEDQKMKSYKRLQKRRSEPESVLREKIYQFRWKRGTDKNVMSKIRDFQRRNHSKLNTSQEKNFTIDEFLLKIGNPPRCYLSGELIDLYDTKSYSLDHIISSSTGGNNSLDNAGLISTSINKMKSDLSVEEFLQKCIQVLKYNGYEINKI